MIGKYQLIIPGECGNCKNFFCADSRSSAIGQNVVCVEAIVGRSHDSADQVCSLSGWVNGNASDETVGKGLAPDLREAAFRYSLNRINQVKYCKFQQFQNNRAWFQSGFAEVWSKPHPDCGVSDKQQLAALGELKSSPAGTGERGGIRRGGWVPALPWPASPPPRTGGTGRSGWEWPSGR